MPTAATSNRWAPIAMFAIVSSANQMLWLNFAPITTGTAHHYGVSSSTVGLLAEVFPLIYVVLALPTGLALDRWFRPTLALGAVLTAGGAALRLAGHGFGPLMIGQTVVALGQPAVLNAITGLASRTLRPADRPTGIAIGSAATFLGFVVAFVLALAMGAGRLHDLLLISAAYSILGAVLLLAVLPLVSPSLTPSIDHLDAVETVEPTGAGALEPGRSGLAGAWAAQRQALRAVWADPAVRVISGMVFLGFGVFVALTTWVQTLLQPVGVDVTTADWLLIVMVAAGVVSSVAAPTLVARRGLQPLTLVIAGLGGATACILLAAVPGTATATIALALFGLVLLPALPILLELLETRCGDRAGTATGLLWLSGNAGGVVVAVLVQVLVHHPAASFGLLAAVSIGAIPLARLLRSALRSAGPASGVCPQPRATTD